MPVGVSIVCRGSPDPTVLGKWPDGLNGVLVDPGTLRGVFSLWQTFWGPPRVLLLVAPAVVAVLSPSAQQLVTVQLNNTTASVYFLFIELSFVRFLFVFLSSVLCLSVRLFSSVLFCSSPALTPSLFLSFFRTSLFVDTRVRLQSGFQRDTTNTREPCEASKLRFGVQQQPWKLTLSKWNRKTGNLSIWLGRVRHHCSSPSPLTSTAVLTAI